MYPALQVQVIRTTVYQSYTEAELTCHSSCSPAGRLSYVWFKNGQKIQEETSSYREDFYPGDNISCAFRGHEDYRSPSLCKCKPVSFIWCNLVVNLRLKTAVTPVNNLSPVVSKFYCDLHLQMLQSFPLCQWIPRVMSWRAVQWLWPVAVMLTQQLNTPGTRRMEIQTFILSVKNHSLSSAPSSPLTLESITVQLRTSWGGGRLNTSLLMWHVSETKPFKNPDTW